jgi:hypothetical protein
MPRSYKLTFTDVEEARLKELAEKHGFTGRGAVVRYLRHLAGLPPLTPGAKPGNQNRKGKTKPKRKN